MKQTKKILSLFLAMLMVFSSVFVGNIFTASAAEHETYYYDTAGTPLFIKDVALTYAAEADRGKSNLTSLGLTILDKDLNDGASGSKFIYLGWSTTTNPLEAITGLRVKMYDKEPSSLDMITDENGIEWYPANTGIHDWVPQLHTDGCVDLNKGAAGKYIYLYVTKDPAYGLPIRTVNWSDTGSTTDGQLTPVVDMDSPTACRNINYGTEDGDKIYLFTRSTVTTVNLEALRVAAEEAILRADNAEYFLELYDLEDLAYDAEWILDTYDAYMVTNKYSQSDIDTTVASINESLSKLQTYVYFDAATNGGVCDVESDIVDVGGELEVTYNFSESHTARKDGYTFEGWHYQKNATTGYKDSMLVGMMTVLYAIFKKDITVTYKDCDGNVLDTETLSVYNNDTAADFTIKEYSKNDKTFLGWDADGDGAADYTAGSTQSFDSDITLTATAECEVNFYGNDGEIVKTENVPYGSDATAPEVPAYIQNNSTEHYKFTGWDKDMAGITTATSISAVYGTEAHTLTQHDAKAPDLGMVGWDAYEECVCGYTTYNELPALDSVGGKCGDNLTWVMTIDGTLTISGEGEMYDYNTSTNCAPWWGYRENIEKLIIEDGITSIGSFSFYVCDSIVDVVIPDSVTSIGDSAFDGCFKLSEVTLSKNLTEIGMSAFYLTDITSVVIPEGVTKIDYMTFGNCEHLETVTIPVSVNYVDWEAFLNCNIETVYYGGSEVQWNKITYMEDNVELAKATIEFAIIEGTCGDNLTWVLNRNTGVLTISGTGEMYNVGENDYYPGWDSYQLDIEKVIVEDGVTSIGDKAFQDFWYMTEVILPDTLKSIGIFAFYNAKALKNITMPNSVESIDKWAFSDCESLESVTFSNNLKSLPYGAFWGCVSLKNIVIPEGFEVIGERAFINCNGLKEVTLPVSLKEIQFEGFYGCTAIETVNYNGTYDQWYAISIDNTYDYEDIVDAPHIIVSKDGVEPNCGVDGNTAGRYCIPCNEYLTGEKIPATGLHTLNDSDVCTVCGYTYEILASGECGDNLRWSINSNNKLVISGTGDMYNYDYDTMPWYDYSYNNIKTITIEDGVTSIGDYAFCECINLTSVTIPNSVTSIGMYGFQACVNLVDIIIPDSVTSIGEGTFGACVKLESIQIPNGVTNMGRGAFYGCTSLESIQILDGVTNICESTFCDCTNLKSVTIPDSVTDIGVGAFANCAELDTVYYGGSEEQWNTVEINNTNNEYLVNVPHVVVDKAEVAPDCDDVGYEAGEYCIKCSEFVSGGVEIPAVGHKGGVATCVTLAVCDVCNNAYGELNKDNHDLVSYPGQAPTYEQDGWKDYSECKNCDYTTYTAIPRFDTGICGDNATYTLDRVTGELRISGTGATYNYNVSEITIPWYNERYSITSLVVEDGITGIGDYAFVDCIYITSVDLPNSLTSIGNCAFWWCESLTEITLPDSVTTIGNRAFSVCTQLKKINIPKGVTVITEYTFSYSNSLETVIIPASVTTIEKGAFNSLSLNTVYYGGTEKQWKAIVIDNTNDENRYILDVPHVIINKEYFDPVCGSAGHEAGEYCIKCKEYVSGGKEIPATDVHDLVFYEGQEPTTEQIGWASYEACTKCDYSTYEEIPKLTYGTCGENLIWTYNTNTKTLTISGTGDMTAYTSYLYTPWYSFRRYISSVVVKDGVTGISAQAFRNCENLTNVTIANSVTSIGSNCFNSCSSLESITLPNGLQSIDGSLFYKCTKLKSITIPASVVLINASAFYLCSSLEAVYYGGTKEQWDAIEINERNNDSIINVPHVIIDIDGLEPGCSSVGCEAGQFCIKCNEYISGGAEIPATGKHTGGEATCTEQAICDVCNNAYGEVNPENHKNIEAVIGTPATCGEEGLTDGEKCTDCGEIVTAQEPIPATGKHTGGEATCTNKAVCDTCGNAYGEVNPENHKNIEAVTGTPATCGDEGLTDGEKCTDCGEIVTAQEPIPATGKHTGGEATCTNKAVCEVCTQSYGEVNANNHKSTKTINAFAATCGKDGYTGDTYCNDCQKTVAQGEVITATGDHKEVVVKGAKEATYDAEGYTGDKHCKECDTLIEKGTAIPKLERPTEPDIPDVPDTPDDPSKDCDHMCHKDGFLGFIWKIVRFFQKLFKIEQYCDCGAQHW